MTKIHAYTDGSYRLSDESFSYGAIILFADHNVILSQRIFNKPEEAKSRNVAGEIYGAAKVMEYAYKHQVKELVIHHDYEGVGAWATKKWKAKIELTKKYVDFFTKVSQKVDITFVWVKAHTGNEFNEQADRLANLATKKNVCRKVKKDERV